MATNLRLRTEAEQAVRAEAQRSGRSQQDVIRDAVDRYLGLGRTEEAPGAVEPSTGLRTPRMPYRRPSRRLPLPPGVTTADLLERDDRL